MAAVGKVRATKNHRGLGSLSGSSVAKLPVTQLVFLCWKIQIANQQEAVRQTPDGNEIFQTKKQSYIVDPDLGPDITNAVTDFTKMHLNSAKFVKKFSL